jgi:hypothetical protein
MKVQEIEALEFYQSSWPLVGAPEVGFPEKEGIRVGLSDD